MKTPISVCGLFLWLAATCLGDPYDVIVVGATSGGVAAAIAAG